jgi:FkbM family methyltransferase
MTVVMRHIKGEFPVEAILRNGRRISLANELQAYTIAQLQMHDEISYDVEDDNVTISVPSKIKGDLLTVRLQGGVNNGEIVECFLNGAYNNLPVEGKTVIDVGSNIGDSSIYFALRGAEKVIGLEPFLGNYEAARKNIELNNLSNKITVLLAGCAANVGYTNIEPGYRSDVSSSIPGQNQSESGHGIRVRLLTLANILEKYVTPSEEIILKMDCEGCEYETILSSSKDILQMFGHIQIEYHHGYRNLKEKLEKNGFMVSVSRPFRRGSLYIGYIYAKRIKMKDNPG